ncbi:MAG: hypothetical protein ACRDZ4_12350 [Egibacteraceae bacterium]
MTQEAQSPETKSRQAVLTQAGYAALGAGNAAFECVRKLSGQLPGRIRSVREQLPDTVAQLADRGRRLTGQVAAKVEEAAEPAEPEAVTDGTGDAE